MLATNIEDLRRAARRRAPRLFFDYVDGGSYSERTMRANIEDFDRWGFPAHYLAPVTGRSLAADFMGGRHKLPLILAPCGFAGMLAPRGEAQAGRAAGAAGIPMVLSNASICPVEEVAQAAGGNVHMQIYLARDRGITLELMQRARAAGATSLFFTVDANILALREKDLKNGFMVTQRVAPRALLDIALHPRWGLDMWLHGGRRVFGNWPASMGDNIFTQAASAPNFMETDLTWKDVAFLRQHWQGRLYVKGIMHADEALRSLDEGADGIVVTNHGGRQLDTGMSSIAVLPRVAEAVGDRGEVLFDSGIRRGAHIAKALALGAHACLIGRPWVYGVAAAGTAGVARAIELLAGELSSVMGAIGLNTIAELRTKGARMIERLS